MGVFSAWFVAIGMQTIRDVRQSHRVPVPSEFVASGAVFAGLAFLAGAEPALAGALAWGFLVALALQAGGPQALVGGGSSDANEKAVSHTEAVSRAEAKQRGR